MLEALGDFVDAALSPELQLDLDHEDVCPEDIVRAHVRPEALGVQLVFIPEEYGGMDGGAFDAYRVCEVMARKDIGLATAVFATFLGSDPIVVGATEEQKQNWLGAIAEQGVVFAYGATEPDAGSDLGALTDDRDPGHGRRRHDHRLPDQRPQAVDLQRLHRRLHARSWRSTPEGPTWFVVAQGHPRLHRRRRRRTSTACGCRTPRRCSSTTSRCPADNLIGHRAGHGPRAGPAGLRLHPADGRGVRPRRRLGGPRPRHRLLAAARAGRRPADATSRATRTS